MRTATTRLAQDGWLEGRRAGKLSEYRLSSDGRARFAEATKRIYGEPNTPWSGRWTLIVLPPMRAAERNAIREELGWRGFGEISGNVFAHPELGFTDAARAAEREADYSPKSSRFEAISLAGGTPRIAWSTWDGISRIWPGATSVSRIGSTRVLSALRRHGRIQPEDGFLLRTLLIHEYRRLHLRDPLLPTQLLRPRLAGRAGGGACAGTFMAGCSRASEAYLSRVAAQPRRAAACRPGRERFGGS